MSFLPSFLLSLELFTVLKPEQPTAWGIIQTAQPLEQVQIESSCIGTGDTIQKAGSSVIFTKAQTDITVSAGTLTAGGCISAMASPLPSVLQADQPYTFTSLMPSIHVPQSSGATTNTMVAVEVNHPAGNLFYLQKEDGTVAAGGGITLSSGLFDCDTPFSLQLSVAGYRAALPEHRSRNWFSLHPYDPAADLMTWRGTAFLQAYPTDSTTISVEESVGCSTSFFASGPEDGAASWLTDWIPGTGNQISPTRWFSRSGLVFSCMENRLMVHGGCYVGDLDYRKINGERLRNTVRTGGGIRWKFQGGTVTGLAATWTLHTPEELHPVPYWQKNVTFHAGKCTLTYTDDSPEQKDKSISFSGSLSVSEAGIAVTGTAPVYYTTLHQLVNGTITLWLKPRSNVRMEVNSTFTEAVQTKLAGELTVTTAHISHLLTGSYQPEDQEATCSYTVSAKWK